MTASGIQQPLIIAATGSCGSGKRRRRFATLRLAEHVTTFLGVPDGGLAPLLTEYWSERGPMFRSPYTRQHRPQPSETITKNPHYRGEDLTQELARILGEGRPTLIVVPRREDQHPDHCAASYFVDDAIADLGRVLPDVRTDLVNYLVHYDDWTDASGSGALLPPSDLDSGAVGWIPSRSRGRNSPTSTPPCGATEARNTR